MPFDHELAALLAAQAAQEFAVLPQFVVVSSFLDRTNRQAAARRVLTLGDSALRRGTRLVQHLAAREQGVELPGTPAPRSGFAAPEDALAVVQAVMEESAQRMRAALDRAGAAGADEETAALVRELQREVDATLVEAQIMASCPGVRRDRLPTAPEGEPAPVA